MKPPLSRRTLATFGAALLIVVGIGILHALSLAYVNDDAFISFRYARNLTRGLGLVYNAGERVEGYTNFLWTLLLAGGMKLGIDPVRFSAAAGLFFYALTILLFGLLSWRMGMKDGKIWALLPLTSLALASHHDFAVYATGGLETSMATFFVSALFVLVMIGRSNRILLLAGVASVLAMMTRPDTVLFVGISLVFIAVTAGHRWKAVGTFCAPVALVFLPYWIARWTYYGFFFPNSFYAKSIDLPYYANGIIYLRLYLQEYYVFLLLIPLAVVVFPISLRQNRHQSSLKRGAHLMESFRSSESGILLAALFILTQCAFVVRIGGDFMFARFLIVVTPFLYFLFEQFLRRLAKPAFILGGGVLIIGLTIMRNDLFADAASIGYVTDEHQVYTDAHLEQSRQIGEYLRTLLAGTDVRVAFWGERARLVYYMDPPLAIEAASGLTDTAIAHRAIADRGRPGHEKKASLEYLRERGVNFFFFPYDAPDRARVMDRIFFGPFPASIVRYDTAIMNRLARQPDIHFVDFPEFLDHYVEQAGNLPPGRLQSDYERFRQYYFSSSPDPDRERRLIGLMQKTPQ